MLENKIKLSNGVEGFFVKNTRFNTTLISFNFFMPLEKESIAVNALLPFMLTTGSKKYPDFSKLNFKLSKLYGAQLSASSEKIGDYQLLKMAVSVIGDRYTLDGESLTSQACELLSELIFEPKHNPEFTTVELYQAYADFHDMMDIAEGIISGAAMEIHGSYEVEWLGEKIDLTPGWRRLTMVDAVKEYAGIDFGAITDDAEAVAAAEKIGVELAETADKTWGNALYACFDQRVEEKLIQPTFITMYPVEVSPLTKASPEDPRLTERFELFVCHSELANAYSELNDPIVQRERFEKQLELRDRGDDEAEMLDEDFLTAMEYGMPPTGGMGIGIDRAVMLLTGADTIREVILFPTMKPLD